MDAWNREVGDRFNNYIQTLWVPVSSFSDGGGTWRSSFKGKHPTWVLTAGTQTASFEVVIPHALAEFKEAGIRVIPTTTGTFNYTVNFSYGEIGEAYNATSKTASVTGAAATDGIIKELDLPISTFFPDLQGGDQLAIELVLDSLTTTTEIHVLGFYLKYI